MGNTDWGFYYLEQNSILIILSYKGNERVLGVILKKWWAVRVMAIWSSSCAVKQIYRWRCIILHEHQVEHCTRHLWIRPVDLTIQLTITIKSGEKQSAARILPQKTLNSWREDKLLTSSATYRFNPEHLASFATSETSREVVLTSLKKISILVFWFYTSLLC